MFTSLTDLGRRLLAVEELPQGAMPNYKEIEFPLLVDLPPAPPVNLIPADNIFHVVQTDKRHSVKFMTMKSRSDGAQKPVDAKDVLLFSYPDGFDYPVYIGEKHKCNCTMQVLMRDGCKCGGV